MKSKAIPTATVRRLCIYKRFLERLLNAGRTETSSKDIGRHTGIPAYQVRKDISHVGEVGVVGKGYEATKLLARINVHLRLTKTRRCVVVGMGSLGTALVGFFSTGRTQFGVVAGIDSDPAKVGRSIGGVPIHALGELAEVVRDRSVEVGILAVPGFAAQATADRLVEAGITALLNFTPAILDTPPAVARRDVDFGIEMEMLLYRLAQGSGRPRGAPTGAGVR